MKRPPSQKKVLRSIRRHQRGAPLLPPTSRIQHVGPAAIIKYPTPDLLVGTGPLMRATCRVPKPIRDAQQKLGMRIPGDVSGLMLVDTGARDTCIADDVARDLGLTPIQKIKAQGVGGVSEHPLYLVAFAVAFSWPNGQPFVIERSSPAMGVFDLDKALAQFSLSAGPDGWPVRVLGLLGRDFLRRVVMIYDGCAGEVHLEVQPKSP